MARAARPGGGGSRRPLWLIGTALLFSHVSVARADLLPMDGAPEASSTPSAYYSVEALWSQSEIFREAAEASQQPMATLESQVRQVDRALASHRLALDLVKNLVDEAEWLAADEHLTGWYAAFHGQHGTAQQFTDNLGARYEELLGGATHAAAADIAQERGLEDLPECSAQGMVAMLRRTRCSGDDLTPLVARAIAGDANLRAAVEELKGSSWPGVEVPQGSGVAFGSGVELDPVTLVRGLPEATAALEEADGAYIRGEQEIERAWEEADADQRRALQERLWQLDAIRRDARTAIGAIVLERLIEKSGASWSFCSFPATMGACSGATESARALELLEGDRRLRRSIERR